MATSDYTGAKYDLRIVRGDDVEETFAMTGSDGLPLDLSDYTFQSQVRVSPAPDGEILGTFTCTKNVTEATVTRTLPRAATTDIEPGTYLHDLQWTDPQGRIRTLFSGKFKVVPEVTR
jgi:hypothetical protein